MQKKLLILALVVLVFIAGGVLVWKEKPSQGLLQSETEKEVIISEGADRSDWKTYRNEEYGFEMKYPKEWDIDNERSSSNEVVFSTGFAGSREAVSFQKNANNITNDKWIQMNQTVHEGVILSQEDTTVGGLNARRIQTGEFSQAYIIFSNEKNIFVITTMGLIEKNKILETFSFL